jgi:ribosomal protein L37AE/L43A
VKPRIRLRFGIWTCTTMRPFSCGCGYSPREAFAEWERIQQEATA